jgi:CubicO group peptidase (beta-lactamase class C family)
MLSRRLGRSIPFAILHLLVAAALAQAALPASSLAASLEQLMADGHVPGVAMAIINNGEIVDVTTAGVRNATSKAPVDSQTVFEAASLSKPVFAYALLQLVDAGILSLDEPLSKHVPDYVPKDPRAAEITVRQALSHTSGLPNFRSEKWPLKTHFAPAERYSYSSEGFMWLQRVVEAATGEHIEDLLQRLVFRPLGMRNSSLVWRPAFDSNYADPHDATPAPRPKRKPPVANAAATLQTTAIDYARFVQAVLRGRRLKPETARAWLAPQVRVRNACFQCLAPDLPDVETHVAWGLGWGLEPEKGTFFHWGHNSGQRAYVVGSVRGRWAVVAFTNSASGLSIMPDLIGLAVPGNRPSLTWLAYPRYTPGNNGK